VSSACGTGHRGCCDRCHERRREADATGRRASSSSAHIGIDLGGVGRPAPPRFSPITSYAALDATKTAVDRRGRALIALWNRGHVSSPWHRVRERVQAWRISSMKAEQLEHGRASQLAARDRQPAVADDRGGWCRARAIGSHDGVPTTSNRRSAYAIRSTRASTKRSRRLDQVLGIAARSAPISAMWLPSLAHRSTRRCPVPSTPWPPLDPTTMTLVHMRHVRLLVRDDALPARAPIIAERSPDR